MTAMDWPLLIVIGNGSVRFDRLRNESPTMPKSASFTGGNHACIAGQAGKTALLMRDRL